MYLKGQAVNKDMVLVGGRIRLRCMTEEDLPLKIQWYNDPEIRKTLILDEILELDKTVQWFQAAQRLETRLDLMIEDQQGRPIGLIGLVQIDPESKSAEIFIVIGDRNYWAKGVMLEAERLLIGWAFETLKLEKIWAQSRTENIASMITMKKIGFRTEGTLRRHAVIAGRPVDVFQVGLLKEDFKNQ